MSEPHAAYERSIERSYLRLRVLLMLASLGEAFPRQLAKSCNIDCWRLDQVLFGGGDYSVDLALVRLGLIEVVTSPHGKLYRITRAGARKARRLAARQARRDRFREFGRREREMRGDRAEPRAWPRVPLSNIEAVATPEGGTASVTWSV